MTQPCQQQQLLSLQAAYNYEVRAGWLLLVPIPLSWKVAYYRRRARHKYRRYLQSLTEVERRSVTLLNEVYHVTF